MTRGNIGSPSAKEHSQHEAHTVTETIDFQCSKGGRHSGGVKHGAVVMFQRVWIFTAEKNRPRVSNTKTQRTAPQFEERETSPNVGRSRSREGGFVSIRVKCYSVSESIPSKAITKRWRGRTPWSGPPAEVCNRGPTWADHPAQAASCAAHACRTYASKGSLDTVFEALPGLSLRVLLLSRFAARIPTLCCTNPWCLAAM